MCCEPATSDAGPCSVIAATARRGGRAAGPQRPSGRVAPGGPGRQPGCSPPGRGAAPGAGEELRPTSWRGHAGHRCHMLVPEGPRRCAVAPGPGRPKIAGGRGPAGILAATHRRCPMSGAPRVRLRGAGSAAGLAIQHRPTHLHPSTWGGSRQLWPRSPSVWVRKGWHASGEGHPSRHAVWLERSDSIGLATHNGSRRWLPGHCCGGGT
mmetsp:Transcript_33565/g.92951  ORF Transcript_33565/g.92951 Transcript_33565/m.92951 type:complete len:209 (+) Transcript_33565:1377-2003(+)